LRFEISNLQRKSANSSFVETAFSSSGTKRVQIWMHSSGSFMMGPNGAAFAAGFGALGALLLIGGAVLLRWQRNRLQFALMQSAIERGTTPMLGTAPLWLLSLRQGVLILVLGIGLMVVGKALHDMGAQVEMPNVTIQMQGRPPARQGPPGGDGGFRRPPPPGEGPPGRAGEREAGPEDGPPREPPAMEKWHRAQDEIAVGTVAMGSGFILVLLGLVRFVFAFAERKYSAGGKGT
jgi:hypothetical protein